MAKKQKGSVRTSLEELNESLSTIEQKILQHQMIKQDYLELM